MIELMLIGIIIVLCKLNKTIEEIKDILLGKNIF